MHVVLIDSPGTCGGRHWSEPFAGELAAMLQQRGADVLRLHGVGAPARLHEVARGCEDGAVEVALGAALRRRPADFVVHAGVGAGGSPNLLWLAERMGSVPIAVARPVEVVCHRGTWIDAAERACNVVEDAMRCGVCCGRAPRRPAPAHAFETRLDLLMASLQVAAAVFHDAALDPTPFAVLGVPARAVRSAAGGDLAAAVAGEIAVSAAS